MHMIKKYHGPPVFFITYYSQLANSHKIKKNFKYNYYWKFSNKFSINKIKDFIQKKIELEWVR